MKRFLLILFICFANCAFAQTETCEIASVKGDVKVFSAEKEKWIDAEPRMVLKIGDGVRTGKSSRCDMRLRGHILKMRENAEITLKELAFDKISLELQKGELLSKLEKLPPDSSFEIRSPVAVSGVRGTSFSCAYNETSGIEGVAVFQNVVSVSCVGEAEKYVTASRLQKVTVSKWSDTRLSATGTGILSEEILGEIDVKKRDKGISLQAEASGSTREEAKKECIRKLGNTLLSRKLQKDLSIADVIKDDPERLKMLYDFIYKKAVIISSEVTKDKLYSIKMELKLEGLNSILGQHIASYGKIIERISRDEYSERFGTLARVTTKRAAQVDGYRRLAEKIYGVVIDSKTTLHDFAAGDDTIVTTVQGIVQGAKIVEEDYFSDGSVMVTMESTGNKILGELKRVTGDVFGVHYISIPVPIEIGDFDIYLELEGY